jgi:hypothetical protein
MHETKFTICLQHASFKKNSSDNHENDFILPVCPYLPQLKCTHDFGYWTFGSPICSKSKASIFVSGITCDLIKSVHTQYVLYMKSTT